VEVMKEYVSTGGVYEPTFVKDRFPTTTDMTKNNSFESDGYLFVPGIIANPEAIFCDCPLSPEAKRFSATLNYVGKEKVGASEDVQVAGSLERYNYPQYRFLHYLVRKEIEPILGIDLLPTYFFDRFYYVGQNLMRHTDRPSCEVSVTLQISTNCSEPWPIWIQKPNGEESAVPMKTGDCVIYKGCEREHWRDPLQSRYNKAQRLWRRIRKKEDDTYHHQIFFHFVNAQGPFVHHAYDAIK